MKKSIILLIISIVALCIPMQAQHMKFMGIPITGTITQFQSKLTAKGVKYDKASSQLLPSGVRAYSGTFAGEDAKIYVYYNTTSKVVYEAKAVMSYATESSRDSKYDDLKSLLLSKYADAQTGTDYQEGHEAFYFRVFDGFSPLGIISIFCSENIYAYPLDKQLHISYTDYLNYLDNDDSIMDDL